MTSDAVNFVVAVVEITIVSFLIIKIFRTVPKWARKCSTQVERIGLVSLCAAGFIFASSAMYWNFGVEGIVYAKTYSDFVTDPSIKPPEAPEGMHWEEFRDSQDPLGEYRAWTLYNTKCTELARKEIERHKPSNPFTIYDADKYQHCEKDHITNRIEKQRLKWKWSIAKYLDAEEIRFKLGLFLLVVGTAMYSGYADKFFRWVKHGK